MRRRGWPAVTLPLAALLMGAALPAAFGQHSCGNAPTSGDLDARAAPARPVAVPSGGAAKAMESYRRFLDLQNADPTLRAEALRRLGDLNLESGELERLANEVTQLDLQGAEAIRLYTTLLKAYPNYPRNDQVLYQLARAYETTAQIGPALVSFFPSIPSSRAIPRARLCARCSFAVASYCSRNGAMRRHNSRMRRCWLAAVPAQASIQQSLYKHGWAQFKQGLNEESLQSFGDLLDLTLDDPKDAARMRSWDSLGRADRELVEDTLRVMSIVFSYLDGAKSIDEFAAHRARMPYAWLVYSRLGDLYIEKQRYQDAATAYRAFVSHDPADEHGPAMTMAAIEAYRKGGFADLMLDGKLEYVQRYDLGTPFLAKRVSRALFRRWSRSSRGEFWQRDAAQYYHASAQKSKSLQEDSRRCSALKSSRLPEIVSERPGSARDQLPACRRTVRGRAISRCGYGV